MSGVNVRAETSATYLTFWLKPLENTVGLIFSPGGPRECPPIRKVRKIISLIGLVILGVGVISAPCQPVTWLVLLALERLGIIILVIAEQQQQRLQLQIN